MEEVLDTMVDTDENAVNGQNKCPKCGATDISLNTKKCVLRCNFCRHEFEPEKAEDNVDVTSLEGDILGAGAKDIEADAQNIITLKCESCGAEVVIDTNEAVGARCHWCRHDLSLNQKVPNGAVPDVVLPFKLTKNEAREHIGEFVSKRKFFAHPDFKKEFSDANVMGVYLPYMIVDANSHVLFEGEGEHEIRSYTVKNGDRSETYYDAELYQVAREFDMTVEDLTIESSTDKLDKKSNKTNNIINSIMPFDTENCVKWDANYLKGYSSEKRDTNVSDVKPLVAKQIKDIAKFSANETLEYYDRGVRWDTQEVDVKGTQWKTAYFPVWLYSYLQQKGKRSMLHYVAVNARTQETMGSIPVNKLKLFLFSVLVEMFSWIVKLFIDVNIENNLSWILLTSGFLFYIINYMVYRNTDERHSHESETKRTVIGIKKTDNFIKNRIRLEYSKMKGANNKDFEG